MADEWGPWIEHDGKGCPLAIGQIAEIVHENASGYISQYVTKPIAFTDHPDWDHRNFRRVRIWRGLEGLCGRVLRYRVRRPSALRRLIDIAEDPQRGLPPRFPVEELA